MDLIFEEYCPFCKAHNYWSNGDISDLTIPDTEGVICWNCNKKFLIEGCEEWVNIEEARIKKGFKVG